jgi:hypothetical protein
MGDESRTPLNDFLVLRKELELYKGGILLKKPALIV